MTKEEAIAVFNSLAIEMTAILAGIPKNESEAKQIQRYIDAYDMAISALRAQQNVPDKDVGKMTNADRIRAMSDEELVNVVPCPLGFSMFRCPIERQCGPCKREWLQQPAEEDDHA